VWEKVNSANIYIVHLVHLYVGRIHARRSTVATMTAAFKNRSPNTHNYIAHALGMDTYVP